MTTPLGIMNGNSTHARNERVVDLCPSRPPSVRDELEIELNVARNMQRNGLLYDFGDLWTRGYEREKEALEQLTILDAIEFRYIRPLPHKRNLPRRVNGRAGRTNKR